jgi:glycosyltransferase involved in cell wall biosynthesis
MTDIAVIILTYNEECHIERAIRSVKMFAREIFVIDSFSSDRTVEIAKAADAQVLQNTFVNQSRQFQWALENAPISAGWILRLDADEIIEADLAAEIELKLPTLPQDVVGVVLKRKHIFMDRWIKHGGRYPLLMIRIFRRGHGRTEDRWIDEHIVVWGGRTVTFEGGFADHNLKDLSFFIDKHNKYATREAVEVLNRRYGFFPRTESLSAGSNTRQASFKRWIKERFYRWPMWMATTAAFLYRYILQLGFLDGKPGFIYHFLQGYSQHVLIGAKVYELDKAVARCVSPEEIREEIVRLTGMNI